MKKAIISLLALVLLTSCWDLTEIEEVGFVLAVAIDPLSEEELAEYQKQYKQETGRPAKQLFKTTYQVVIPSMVVQEAPELEKKPFFNITSVGRTNFKMNRHILARRSRDLIYEHLKALIINEQLLKTGDIGKFIDLYLRDHEMRRDTLVYVSKGAGETPLKEKLPLETMPAISIKMIHENHRSHHGMPAPKPIGEIATSVLDEQSYIVPRISAQEGKQLIIAGAAVFLGGTNELLGWLGEEDVAAFNLVVGESKNTGLEATLNDQLFNFEMDKFRTGIKYQLKDGQDFFEINVKAEGFFVENWLDDIDISEDETNERLEAAVEEEIERIVTNIVEKMQREFQADIFEMGKTVKQNNYQRWKEIKDQWDGKDGNFSKANIEIKADVKIRHYMTENQLR